MLIRRATTVLIFVCATRVWGQGTGAEITGAVTDSTGGFIPNATITIINSQTNAQRTLTTNSSGFYDAPALPPGKTPRPQRTTATGTARRIVSPPFLIQVSSMVK